ncbi:MAG: hypothetical protein ACAH95_08755 [Fimbriimonas sp.]
MPASAASLSQAYADQKRRTAMIVGIVAIIAILAAATVALTRGGRSLGAGAGQNAPVLNAQGQTPDGNILAAVGNQGPAVLNKEEKAPEKMPQDVFDWLKHLERCEKMKVEIAGDQAAELSVFMTKFGALGAGMGMFNPYDQASEEGPDQAPGQYTKGKVLDLRPKWTELIGYFRSKTPPEECRTMAGDFDRALSEIPGMMGDVGDILNSADADPAAAMKLAKKLQNSSYSDIDRYFARTDEKLGQICKKYNTNKWFNVASDVMGGGMLGKFP